MNQSTYQYLYNDILNALRHEHLLSALHSLQGMASTLKSWSVKEEADTLLDSYQILLSYMAKGANDPDRKKVFKGFVRRTYELADILNRVGLLTNSNAIYTTSLHTLQNMYSNDFRLADILTPDKPTRDKFDSIWLSGAWTADDEATIAQYLKDEANDEIEKCLLLSAITLASLQFFDIAKYRVLLDYAMSSNIKIRARALTGIIFNHVLQQERIQLYPEIKARLTLLSDLPVFVKDIELLQMQLFLSLETKRIEHDLQNEIMPQVIKRIENLRLDRSLGLNELQEKLSENDLNPEWNKGEEAAKLDAYMQKFAELQQRGADMYMGSFKVMKQRFPFFNTVSNWFWPFTMNHPEVPQSSRNNKLIKALINRVGLCDSDKYSFCFVAAQVPSVNKLTQSQNDMLSHMNDMQQELEMDTEQAFKNELRSYVQDFYRFSLLYSRHDQFANPFQHNLLIVDYAPFDKILDDTDFLLRMADFAFNDKSYTLAANIYNRLPEDALSAKAQQKNGYCYEAVHDFSHAISHYERAHLLNPQSAWTLRRLAICHRANEHYDEALCYYNKIAEIEQENAQIALRQAECLIHLKRYNEAFKFLFKANYLSPTMHASERALAWCSLLTKKYEQAEKFYLKVLADAPTTTDYLNAGHSAWLLGNISCAIERYRKALPAEKPETFLTDDRELLINAGFTPDDLAMMTDAVLSHL